MGTHQQYPTDSREWESFWRKLLAGYMREGVKETCYIATSEWVVELLGTENDGRRESLPVIQPASPHVNVATPRLNSHAGTFHSERRTQARA